jgi:hypothetical protein
MPKATSIQINTIWHSPTLLPCRKTDSSHHDVIILSFYVTKRDFTVPFEKLAWWMTKTKFKAYDTYEYGVRKQMSPVACLRWVTPNKHCNCLDYLLSKCFCVPRTYTGSHQTTFTAEMKDDVWADIWKATPYTTEQVTYWQRSTSAFWRCAIQISA